MFLSPNYAIDVLVSQLAGRFDELKVATLAVETNLIVPQGKMVLSRF